MNWKLAALCWRVTLQVLSLVLLLQFMWAWFWNDVRTPETLVLAVFSLMCGRRE